MFRFGRAYPASGTTRPARARTARGGSSGSMPKAPCCAVSDYGERRRYLEHVGALSDCAARGALGESAGAAGPCGFRAASARCASGRSSTTGCRSSPISRSTTRSALSRADFVRLALATQPGEHDVPPYSEQSLADFEKDYCEDRYWSRPRDGGSATRASCVSGRVLGMVGRARDLLLRPRDRRARPVSPPVSSCCS